MPALMVSGCGNIGSRLIQSLSNLESGPYDIYGIEPYKAGWDMVRERFDQENKGGHTLHLMAAPQDLPETVDLLIVSVDARNRLAALQTAIEATTPKAILLEKILFTNPDDFQKAQEIIDELGVPCWVNCSRNIWPGYKNLKAELDDAGTPITHYDVEGTDWHLGSNAIHFLAALEYLADSPIAEITLEDNATIRDAKRAGYKEVVGMLSGHTENGATFRIASLPVPDMPISVKVTAGERTRIIKEGQSYHFDGDDTQYPFPMLYTSQLEGPLAEIIGQHKSDLPEYSASKHLHLKLFNELGKVLDLEPDGSLPIT